MDDERIAHLRTLYKDTRNIAQLAGSQMAVYQTLSPSIANAHTEELRVLCERCSEARTLWSDPKTVEEQRYAKVSIPHFLSMIDSTSARIRLSSVNGFMSSPEKFELCLRMEALTLRDVETAEATYHRAVRDSLELQDGSLDFSPYGIGQVSVPIYQRTCEALTFALDKKASELFRKEINTPADFDPKERSPHQFLQRINVGFEHLQPNLVRTIAHEGPFGHNTHMSLSRGSSFETVYRHQSEGLAILGEQLALEEYYSSSDDLASHIAKTLRVQRVLGDALGTAFEYLAFYEALPAKEIAKRLASEKMSEELLLQQFNGLDSKREASFQFGTSVYYAGMNIIREAYDNGMKNIGEMTANKEQPAEEQEKYRKYLRTLLLRTLFTGLRTARVTATDALLALEEEKVRETTTSSSSPMGINGFGA